MIIRSFTRLLGVLLALVLGGAASAALVKSVPCGDGCSLTLPSGGNVLYSQLDDPSGSGFTDQEFEAVYAAYNSEGGDDFNVGPAGWDLTTIYSPGIQTNLGTPFFTNHFFYADAGNVPGAVLDGCDFPANTSFTHDLGDLATDISGCTVEGGVNWFSQNVRQDFVPFGQHFWATRASSNGNEAVFRNPGNGFGSGCIDWSPANTVCGMTGSDFLFELVGSESNCCCLAPSCAVPAAGTLGLVSIVAALGAASAVILRRRR